MERSDLVVVTGGAGLVGQNLIHLLCERGYTKIVSIDKHAANNAILRRLNPRVTVIDADLAEPGDWKSFRRRVRASDVAGADRRSRLFRV